MKPNLLSPTSRRPRTRVARCQHSNLAEFERSGLSAAAFAQPHHVAWSLHFTFSEEMSVLCKSNWELRWG